VVEEKAHDRRLEREKTRNSSLRKVRRPARHSSLDTVAEGGAKRIAGAGKERVELGTVPEEVDVGKKGKPLGLQCRVMNMEGGCRILSIRVMNQGHCTAHKEKRSTEAKIITILIGGTEKSGKEETKRHSNAG